MILLVDWPGGTGHRPVVEGRWNGRPARFGGQLARQQVGAAVLAVNRLLFSVFRQAVVAQTMGEVQVQVIAKEYVRGLPAPVGIAHFAAVGTDGDVTIGIVQQNQQAADQIGAFFRS
jgi:hypothetical protein